MRPSGGRRAAGTGKVRMPALSTGVQRKLDVTEDVHVQAEGNRGGVGGGDIADTLCRCRVDRTLLVDLLRLALRVATCQVVAGCEAPCARRALLAQPARGGAHIRNKRGTCAAPKPDRATRRRVKSHVVACDLHTAEVAEELARPKFERARALEAGALHIVDEG